MSGKRRTAQTFFAVGITLLTRSMGFGLRLLLSRRLGAAALGVTEQAAGLTSLFTVTAVCGLPGAVSTLTAREEKSFPGRALAGGLRLALFKGLILGALLLLFIPAGVFLTGCPEAAGALLCTVPALPCMAVCCAADGYFFGLGRALPPALGEWTEQAGRLAAAGLLTALLPLPDLKTRALVPALAGTVGEYSGLLCMLLFLRRAPRTKPDRAVMTRLSRLSLPLTGSRVASSLLRSCTVLILPRLLQKNGLSPAAASGEMGLFYGMAMPVLLLPGMVLSTLCALAAPGMARRQGGQRRQFALRMLLLALAAGGGGTAGCLIFSSFLAGRVFRQPALAPLLRLTAPLSLIMALSQTFSALLTGLRLQKKAFAHQLTGGAVSFGLTLLFTPRGGVTGAAAALALGQGVQCALHGLAVFLALRRASLSRTPSAASDGG